MSTTLPDPIVYGTVIGRLIAATTDSADADDLPDAAAMAGTVTFTPSTTAVLLGTAVPPTTLVPKPITVTLDATGAFTVKLVATDIADATPLGGVTNAGGWSVMDLDDLRVDQLTAPAVFDELLTAPTLVLARVGNVIDARGSTHTGTPTFAITDADGLTYEQVTPGVFVFDDDGTGHTIGVSLTDDVDTATGTIALPAVTATRRVGELVRIGDRWQ
ncbi:hypothetical protein OEB99_17880 [Actinotalea sp. M2MS4P-6]|uniref:hypothetical protein n=1 Tax=Actinotalea sp. M2MS4P-6 TaxID=2983762 RepID=UPI0021E48BA5|nr:hypothetical protein [Actinotalea sp. M2MS4P-6]MCV2396184.1 hypothetical protein [Actinotalea sp. M2MS4P-6]